MPETAAASAARRQQSARPFQCAPQLGQFLVMPNLLEACVTNIGDRKTETASVNGYDLAIRIDHEHAIDVVAATPDENLRSPVIGDQFIEFGDIRLDRNGERIDGLRDFGQLCGQFVEIDLRGIRFENIGRSDGKRSAVNQIVALCLGGGDEIVVDQADTLERQTTHVTQKLP